MRTVNQKIISLFYLLLWFTPLLIILLVSLRKEDIHRRMKDELKSKDLQTVVIAENSVHWMDEHEIWVDNSMFDIHTQQLENGIYTFTGLYDNDETELVLEQQANNENDPEQNELLTQLFQCLNNLFHSPPQEFNTDFKKSAVDFNQHSSNLLTLSQEIITPPPQF